MISNALLHSFNAQNRYRSRWHPCKCPLSGCSFSFLWVWHWEGKAIKVACIELKTNQAVPYAPGIPSQPGEIIPAPLYSLSEIRQGTSVFFVAEGSPTLVLPWSRPLRPMKFRSNEEVSGRRAPRCKGMSCSPIPMHLLVKPVVQIMIT